MAVGKLLFVSFSSLQPVSFGKKTDKNGDYIRKWIPKLQKMPAKYIYEPWGTTCCARQAGCIVGVDTGPIVDHKVVSKRNMVWMKEAYARHRQNSSGSKRGNVNADKSRKRKKSSGSRKKQTKLVMQRAKD